MKAVIVGLNPSQKSPDCSAFHVSTRSRQVIDEWFIFISHPIFINLFDYKTDGNNPIKIKDLRESTSRINSLMSQYKGIPIIGLGRLVARGLNLVDVNFHECPHPSGLNRKLNDPQYVEQMLKETEDYVRRH